MLDFGALPPEINSARMYAGPGSGPMLAAASAWDALAAQLEIFASGYHAAIGELLGASWSGPASTAMEAAVAPYIAWAAAATTQAVTSANQARAAAAAFDAAFAGTVPPALVYANRTLLTTLVATNFFGQNTPAIAATESAYAEMWAQDAASMYAYAASAADAATLTPFGEPPETTSPIGQPAQAVVAQAVDSSTVHSQTTLAQLISAIPQQLQTLASGGAATNVSAADTTASSTSLLTAMGYLNTVDGPLNIAYQVPYTTFSGGTFLNGLTQSKVQSKDLPLIEEEDAAAAVNKAGMVVPDGVEEPLTAVVARADQVGALSVPQTWLGANPGSEEALEAVASNAAVPRILPPWTSDHAPAQPGEMPGIGRIPGTTERHGSKAIFRMRDRRYRIPRPALGG